MKIDLPPFIIAGLYKNSLVQLDEEKPQPADYADDTAPDENVTAFYAGSNTQHITIVLSSATHLFADDESLQLLSNVLAALQYTLADVAIINHHRTPVDYIQIKEALQPRVCLLFGIGTQALQLPFIIPFYQSQPYDNCTFMQACAIDDMKANDEKAKAEKRKLWTCLKTVFNR